MGIFTIYKVLNSENQKVYIGFDSNWPSRKHVHKSSSKKEDTKFYRALRKYGIDAFHWEPIYQSTEREHTLKVMEPYFIKEYDSFSNGYNSTLGGDGVFGLILSEEAKQKISKGNQIPKPQTEEHIRKRTESRLRNIQLGLTKQPEVSDQTKIKISLATVGKSKKFSEQHKKNLHCHINNSIKVACPNCGKIGQLTNMKRWHFENCKLIPKTTVVDTK